MVRRKSNMVREMHPTKAMLIETTVGLLDRVPLEQLTGDAVLEASGISRGSLYHHFEDYPDLLEHALVARYARYVDESILGIGALLDGVSNVAELRVALSGLNRVLQAPERAANRFERAVTLANSVNSPRFRERLGEEQERLTAALMELVEQAKARGWVRPGVDSRALAVLMQAYTLGRIIDDIAPVHVDQEAWLEILEGFFSAVCTG